MPTVDAVILLGWMERDEAVQYLQGMCVADPPLTAADAEALWVQYRDRVAALPRRSAAMPARHPIPATDRQHVNNFLARHRGPEVLDVIRVNPMELAVCQLYVVTDRAQEHAQASGPWCQKTLVIDRPTGPIAWRIENGVFKFMLPHAEHMFGPHPQTGAFLIMPGGGFVGVVEFGGRLLLKAGYHRSFAFSQTMMNAPVASARSALVALTATLPPQLLPNWPHQGLRTVALGVVPPLFADFFNSDLAMTVKLRRKNFELHVSATVHAVDAP